MKTNLMTKLFSGEYPEFSEKVQEGITEARTNGKFEIPEENLKFSVADENKVEILDEANNEVTVATPNPNDANDEILEVGEVKKESEEEAQKKAEEEEKASKKAELEQQISNNLGEIDKAVSDMKETDDKRLAEEVKDQVAQMSDDLDEIPDDLGIDKVSVKSTLKTYSDAADEVIEKVEEPTDEPNLGEETSVEVKTECGDKKFSITFTNVDGSYVANFMRTFSDKMEEIAKAEEEALDEEIRAQSEQEPETVISNNLDQIEKAVEDLKENKDKELAGKITEKLDEVKADLKEAKLDENKTKEFSDRIQLFSDAVEEATKEDENEKNDGDKKEGEEGGEGEKTFSNLDDYFNVAPRTPFRKDKTFSAKEVEDAKTSLGGCLMHKF